MSIRETYFSHVSKNLLTTEKSDLLDNPIWNHLKKYEKETGRVLEDGQDRAWYLGLFQVANVRSVRQFNKEKLALYRYLEYLEEQGLVEYKAVNDLAKIQYKDVPTSKSSPQFIKNIVSLRETINAALAYKFDIEQSVIDETAYDASIGILYLSWYGFTTEEISRVLKTDVVDHGVMKDGTLVEMEPFIVELLTRLRDSEGIYSQAKEVIFRKYKESDKLFRTIQVDHIDPKTMTARITKFTADTEIKNLTIKNVFTCGAFYRMFIAESVNNSNPADMTDEEFTKLFRIKPSYTTRYEKMMAYQKYKELFL